jgi:hypothetical protein
MIVRMAVRLPGPSHISGGVLVRVLLVGFR